MASFEGTVGTVRLVLLLLGLGLCVVGVSALAASEAYNLMTLLAGVDVALGCFYTYVSARFDHLLAARPRVIVGGLLALVGLNLFWVLVTLRHRAFGEAVRSILAGLVGVYLIVSVRRLAAARR
jgi:hypothetical protein